MLRILAMTVLIFVILTQTPNGVEEEGEESIRNSNEMRDGFGIGSEYGSFILAVRMTG